MDERVLKAILENQIVIMRTLQKIAYKETYGTYGSLKTQIKETESIVYPFLGSKESLLNMLSKKG